VSDESNEDGRKGCPGSGKMDWVGDPVPAKYILFPDRFQFEVTDGRTYRGILHRKGDTDHFSGAFTFRDRGAQLTGHASCDLKGTAGDGYKFESGRWEQPGYAQLPWRGWFVLDE
jgi:hypothetical protein